MSVKFIQAVLKLVVQFAEHWIVKLDDVLEVLVLLSHLQQLSEYVCEVDRAANRIVHSTDLFSIVDVVELLFLVAHCERMRATAAIVCRLTEFKNGNDFFGLLKLLSDQMTSPVRFVRLEDNRKV
jgi:hypothetical protein